MPSTEIFLARQPIFDAKFRVCAYEILSRSGPENSFGGGDPEQKSAELIAASLDLYTLRGLAGSNRVFINLTRELVLGDFVRVLPPESTVLELLESVAGDPDVVEACLELKREGYAIALDDFDARPALEPLVPLADILKVDFLSTTPEQRRAIGERHAESGLTLLAEKVETRAQVDEAIALGFTLFQGFFFCAPEMLKRREIPKVKANYLRLFEEFARPDLTIERIEAILRAEPSLTVKLLRHLNSASFGLRNEITSLRQALVYLGERPLRRWGSLALVTGLGEDKPQELVVTTLVRAQFCERLASLCGNDEASSTWFLAGLLSTLDALTDRPLDEALAESSTCAEIVSALTGAATPLGRSIQLAIAYERGDFELATELASAIGLGPELLPGAYKEAVRWTGALFEDAQREP